MCKVSLCAFVSAMCDLTNDLLGAEFRFLCNLLKLFPIFSQTSPSKYPSKTVNVIYQLIIRIAFVSFCILSANKKINRKLQTMQPITKRKQNKHESTSQISAYVIENVKLNHTMLIENLKSYRICPQE